MSERALSERKVGAVLFLSTLAIYLILPNRNYHYDSAAYAWFIKSGNMLFHPHHLLHSPLGFLLVRGLHCLGIPASPMVTMQILNSLAGALGVWLFFRILSRLSQNLFSAVVFSLLLSFCFAYWYNSIENEVVMIPLTILLYIFYRLVHQASEEKRPEPLFWVGLGIAASFAVLFHQMHVLFLFVAIAFIARKEKGIARASRMSALYLAPYLPVVGGAYLLAARFTGHLSSWSSFFHWSTLYVSSHPRGLVGGQNLRLALYGIPRVFLRATFLKNFLLNRIITPGGALLVFGALIAGLTLIYLVFRTAMRLRRIWPQRESLFLLAWVLVYGIFAVWWEPHNPDFYLSALPPFWALLCLGTKDTRRSVVLVFLIALFSVNLTGEIIPNSSLERNEAYQLVLKLRSHGLTHQDLVLTPDPVIDPYYLYFFDEELRVSSLADIESPSEENKRRIFSEVEGRIEETLSSNGRVFVSESELRPNPRKLHPTRRLTVSDYGDFYQKYEGRLRKLFSYTWDGREVGMFELER